LKTFASESGWFEAAGIMAAKIEIKCGEAAIMKLTCKFVLLLTAFVFPSIIGAQVPVGRWEIVHLTGDNSSQTALYPGSFSTFLKAGGTGYTYGTFTNSICVLAVETSNIVPTWVSLGGNTYQITITVDNLGLGPNLSFVYTGTYNALTSVPGDILHQIPAITGTYYGTGDASACSNATQGLPGTFVATFLPTLSSGSASGSLDGMAADSGLAFDSTVNATISFSTPPAGGQLAGNVELATNPTFNGQPCFATTAGTVNPLTINASKSAQSGVSEYILAEGYDPYGTPTSLFLNAFSANVYTTSNNTDPNATQVSTTEWAVAAAIGEDNLAAGIAGIANDGTNNVIVMYYGVLGGICNNAGGVDAPFQFVSGTPLAHGHNKHHHHGNRPMEVRDHVPRDKH